MIKFSNYLKNKTLAFQIWIVFSLAMLIILLVLMAVIMFTVKSFLMGSIYRVFENAEKNNLAINHLYQTDENKNNHDTRLIHYIVYPGAAAESIDNILNDKSQAKSFWDNVLGEYHRQAKESKIYRYSAKGENIFYEITKYNLNGKQGFIFSYTRDTYTRNLYTEIIRRLILIIIITSLFMLVAARKLARFLSNPIMLLKNNVEKIGLKDWSMPINIDRKDEIGELSRSIELMRQQLVKRDEAQQWMLQNISHELKTPVMVIRSYAQSVGDGIFPKGDLNSTMQVIDSEAERLDKRIKDLLYLTKLEYMLQHKKLNEAINMKKMIESIVERFSIKRQDISWELKLKDLFFFGDWEQLNVVFENILENSMRYCKGLIKITLVGNDKLVLVKIYNDGEHIEDERVGEIFKPFQKGKQGKFGLGLAIVKQIIDAHNGSIWVKNEQVGITFFIKLVESPLHDKFISKGEE